MKKCKNHSRFIFILLAVMILGLMGAQHAFAKKMKFTMQTMFSMNHPITVATTQMIEKIKKETNGDITIQMLPPGALVKGPNIFEAVAMGSISMGITCSSYHSSILPMAATSFALPGDGCHFLCPAWRPQGNEGHSGFHVSAKCPEIHA